MAGVNRGFHCANGKSTVSSLDYGEMARRMLGMLRTLHRKVTKVPTLAFGGFAWVFLLAAILGVDAAARKPAADESRARVRQFAREGLGQVHQAFEGRG